MIGGTLYEGGFSSGDIGAAVAEAILHDIRINGLGLAGFPQIFVKRTDRQNFSITLSFAHLSETFDITAPEAKAATKTMKSCKGHNPEIFDRVQGALAKLEGARNQD